MIFHNLEQAQKSGFYFFHRAERNLLARDVVKQKELNAQLCGVKWKINEQEEQGNYKRLLAIS